MKMNAGIQEIKSGMILLWYGSIASIPAGFALCNGSNGTPDLRNKFIVCAKQDDGGVAKSDITGSLLQSGGGQSHTHTVSISLGAAGMDVEGGIGFSSTSSGNTGTALPIPVFYALAYIMKL